MFQFQDVKKLKAKGGGKWKYLSVSCIYRRL